MLVRMAMILKKRLKATTLNKKRGQPQQPKREGKVSRCLQRKDAASQK